MKALVQYFACLSAMSHILTLTTCVEVNSWVSVAFQFYQTRLPRVCMPVLGLQMSCVEPSINLIELSLLRNIWCLSKLELERTSNKCIIIKKNLRLLENRMKIGHKVFIHANI